MNEMLSQAVFKVSAQTYCWQEVLIAAKLRGDWADLEAITRQGAECLKKMSDTEGALVRGVVEAAASEFRYARNLITAQETEDWLSRWGLSVEEWFGYFRRYLLRERYADRLEETISQCALTDGEVGRLFWIDAICSGRLAEWAKRLAGRAAVSKKLKGESPERFDSIDEDAEAMIAAVPPEVRNSPLPGLAHEAFSRNLKCIARMEAAHNLFSKDIVTAKAVKERIGANYLDWIRFECATVAFTDELMAKEAALCVREDGLELDDVARDAKRPINRAVMYLDQVEPALKEHLLAGQKGTLIGPVKLGSEYTLFWLADKQMPSDDDPEIRKRAEESLLKTAVAYEINNRVQWLARL